MLCEDCKDNGKCEIQERQKKLAEEGRGAVFIGDKLIGCNKYDKDGNNSLIVKMRTQIGG